ncbi:thiol reductant ABC exporter subunit CydC [Bacillus shivajii]|uniref:thiol reductant ABC exporter subunit CydC n=1 Tax=Bacillus shivajii TaxID=1983719 RepID=UPI001CFB4285|nr:thiol reductant ABC exporter subunit CydC [Bacillus shivajii]UCZ52592.1 thiol reductant ABC exporter subunit CydC [Bacillus shivajii]
MKDLKIVMKLVVAEKKDVLLSILFGFLAGMAAVSLFANSGYLISRAAITPPLYILTISIALLKLFSFTRAFSRYAERYYSHRATFTILSNLRVYFFERLEPLAPRIFHKYRSGDLLARIVGDVESLQNFFLRVYYPPIVMVIIFLATIAFTLYFSVAVAITLIIGLILTGFLVPYAFALKQRGIENKVREKRGHLSTEATEFLYGFRDLKLYQKLDEQEENLLKASRSYVGEQNKEGVQAIFSQTVNQLIALLISWFVLAMGAYLVTGGELDGVFLAMLVMISLTVFENSTPMAVFPYHFEDSRLASKRLFSVVDEQEVEKDEGGEQLDNQRAPSIKIEKLSFQFPGEHKHVLRDISVNITSGSKVAVVGPSGSGKSTILQLLLKVYKDFKGDVMLGEKKVSSLDEESIWQATNVVLQENHFFYGTIRDNLMLAKDGVSDDEMIEVLEKVDLTQFSLSGEVLEKGQNLSGGEKQRLAIARALLKGAHLWLLDEPTSSVDAITEKKIFDHLLEQGQDDTILLISHRLTGLESFDQIIVMEHGKVVESGTFNELMEKKGYFYEMKQIEQDVFL